MTTSVKSEVSSLAPPDPAPPPTQSLARAVYARRQEYIRPHRIRIKVGTWNVAGLPDTCDDLARWFVDGEGLDRDVEQGQRAGAESFVSDDARVVADGRVGLYVLGLQEVIDINNKYEYVTYADPGRRKKWIDAMTAQLPGYEVLVEERVRGLLLVVFVAPEARDMVSNVRVTSVGTGMFGLVANKGAVGAQLLLGETTRLALVNSHLASGPTQQDRRIWDIDSTVSRMRFPAVRIPGAPDNDDGNEEKLGDEDVVFWFGDLNFRIDGVPGDQLRQLFQTFCTGEYVAAPKRASNEDDKDGVDVDGVDGVDGVDSRPDSDDEYQDGPEPQNLKEVDLDDDSEEGPEDYLPNPDDFEPELNPESLQAILESIRPHDQLLHAIKQRRAFHDGWQEGNLTFMPTYKYDVNTVDTFDTSLKQRAPSWCDRILYRTRAHREAWETQLQDEAEAKKRDEEMRLRGFDAVGDDDDDDILFDYDPDKDGGETQPKGKPGFDYDEYDELDDDDAVGAVDETRDRLKLEMYTSHQRICSSDHKPVAAVFSLDFDGVDPRLKAAVHAEVARELDRAENEGRPVVTVVGDGSGDGPGADFGNVTYRATHTRVLTVANTGGITAKCSFVAKQSPAELQGDPAWLTTSFLRPGLTGDMEDTALDLGREVEVDPGDTVTVQLDLRITDMEHVRRLNAGLSTLEDVLVLRVDNGRDYFVSVRAAWTPTSFGRSIEDLILIPDAGIRSPSPKSGTRPDRGPTCPFPRELMALCEAVGTLLEKAIAADDVPCDVPSWPFQRKLLEVEGLEGEMQRGIEALDTRQDIAASFTDTLSMCAKLEAASCLLVEFLASINDGIITPRLYTAITSAVPNLLSLSASSQQSDLETAKGAILDALQTSPHHNITFVFLADTLATVCARLAPAIKPAEPEARRFRTFSFRATTTGGEGGRDRPRERERKVGEIVGKAVCRVDSKGRGWEERVRGVVEVFLKREARTY